MATMTKTLKPPFLRLNRAKADEFLRLERLSTEVARIGTTGRFFNWRRLYATRHWLRVWRWTKFVITTPASPAPHCGAINKRHKHAYVCTRCGHKAHADANAAMNIRDWYGLCCPLILDASMGGPHELALNPVRQTAEQSAA